MSTAVSTAAEIPPPELRAGPDHVGKELKRGMFFNTIALLASNFRGVFTFLIARMLGAAALGTFLVAWATTDILSRIGLFGLDNAIIAFIARSERAGDHARSRALFHLGALLAVMQSVVTAALAIVVVQLAGTRLGFDPQVVAVLSLLLCAMPGVNLYRTCTAVSRGMKVMKHDIWSRGLTESTVTTLAFVGAVLLGWRTYGAAIGAIIGTGASGLVALALASSLFRSAPSAHGVISYRREARRLLGYSASISGYDLINSFIVRLDVIMLGAFVGHAPGVTLARVGIYGAVVEVANGLRKVNQTFTPIFAPVVARMTADGDQRDAAATFARVAQWMLWVLLPMLGVLAFAGGLMLTIYGQTFRQGAPWLDVVAIACGANTFVGLAETVIMVQRPGINLANSIIACIVAVLANIAFISLFGVIGAAFGILLPYLLLGVLRHRTLRLVFGWEQPWRNVAPPVIAAIIALALAIPIRLLLHGILSEVLSAIVFLLVFGLEWWWFHYRRERVAR
ncbi:MAG TPA: oligosaccharide flippase family protein [Chthoniobacterales bacterium]